MANNADTDQTVCVVSRSSLLWHHSFNDCSDLSDKKLLIIAKHSLIKCVKLVKLLQSF